MVRVRSRASAGRSGAGRGAGLGKSSSSHPQAMVMTFLSKLAVGMVARRWRPWRSPRRRPTAKQAQKLMQDGNYQEALEQFRELTLEGDGGDSSELIAELPRRAELLSAAQPRRRDRRVPRGGGQAARRRLAAGGGGRAELHRVQHQGYLIAGEFQRGRPSRRRARWFTPRRATACAALQLFHQALEMVDDDDEREDRATPARCAAISPPR